MQEIRIENKKIGGANPCYTIAEAGANHDGKVENAFKLIDAASEAKADCIKFQTFTAKKLVTRTAPKYWDDGITKESQFDVFKKLDILTKDNWREIFEYAKKKKITCFSTPFDEESVDFLYSLDVPAFKIASADITHLPLIKKAASKKLPIFISTGMAVENEIQDATNAIENEGNRQIVIMHCMISYPTKPEDANLEMIRMLSKKYPDHIIGYSDHSIGTVIPICSTFYGSKCIEKHFTFDTTLNLSRDHRLSLDIEGFSQLVNGLRLAEISKGSGTRIDFQCEAEGIKYARRSVVSTIKIPKGTIITRNMLDIKRPGTGLLPKEMDRVVGAKAVIDIEEDVPIKSEYISN